MAVRVQDTIKSKNDADFPVVDSSDIKGGHHEVTDAAARDAITASHRSVGMKVVTQDDGKTWQLDANATTWTEFTGGGGGGTLAGDVTGASGANTVSAIQGIPSPSPDVKVSGSLVVLQSTTVYPLPAIADIEAIESVSDGDVLYVPEFKINFSRSPGCRLHKFTMSGGKYSAYAFIDLVAAAGVHNVRDIAQDTNYLYLAGWNDGSLVVVSKATFTVVGIAFISLATMLSVCTDGAGSIFVNIDTGLTNNLLKFRLADLLTSYPTPVTLAYDTLVQVASWVRYGGGKVWLANANGPDALYRVNPGTTPGTMVVETSATFGSDSSAVIAIYDAGSGSVWVGCDARDGHIYRVDPTTLAVQYSFLSPGFGWGGPASGIAVDAGGDIWVTTQGSTRILQITPSSNAFQMYGGGFEKNGFEGISFIGSFAYLQNSGRANTEYVDTSTLSFGPLPVAPIYGPAPYLTWGLAYAGLNGEVSGDARDATVKRLSGLELPGPAAQSLGNTLQVAEAQAYGSAAFHPLALDGPIIWVGCSAGLLVRTDTSLFGGDVSPFTSYDLTKQLNVGDINDIQLDEKYLYLSTTAVGFGNPGNVVVVEKMSGAVVGSVPVSPIVFNTYLDGAGNLWFCSPTALYKYSAAAVIDTYPGVPSPRATVVLSSQSHVLTGDGTYVYLTDGQYVHKYLASVPTSPVATYDTTGPTVSNILLAAGFLWAQGSNFIYKIDPATMTGTGSATTANGQLVYWPANGSLPGDLIAIINTDTDNQIERILVSTGASDGLFNTGVVGDVLGMGSVYDPINDAFWLGINAAVLPANIGITLLNRYDITNPRFGYHNVLTFAAPTAVPSTFVVGGDLLGSSGSQSVQGFWNVPIANVFQTPGCIFTYTGSQWYPNLPNGDLSGRYDTGVTVSRINGGTAPATPLLADVGKVIGVTAAGVYGLITAGGSVGGPQAGNNFAPVKVNVSGAAVQSWINLNGGYGFDTNNKDSDVSGVLRVQQAGTSGIRTSHIGRNRITPNDEQIPAMGINGSTTKNTGRFLKLVDGSAPSGVGYDIDASKMAIARAGCFDLVVQPSARFISTEVIPLDVDPQDDYDGGGQTYHPQTYGRVVLKGNLAYSIATWGSNKLAFLETDITRGTVRKLASYGTGTIRTAFIDCAHDSGYSVTGDSDVFAVWWQGFGNNYWIQNLTLGSAGIATTVTIASGTVTSVRVARPAGVTFPTSPSGRIFIGLSTGSILEYDGSVNPPTYVRTLTATGGAVTAMTSGCYFSGDRLWAMDASGHIDRFDLTTNTWSGSNNVAFAGVVAMRSTYYGYLALINATTVGMITAQNSAMNLVSTLPMHLFGDVQYVNYTDLAYTGGSGPMTMIVTDSLNGGFWGVSSDSSGTLSWTDGSYDSFYDLNGLATWSKAGVDLSDVDSYTSAIPVRNVLGGNRISGAYFRGNAAALTVGTSLKVVLGAAPTEIIPGDLISRPGSKDIVLCSLTAGAGVTGSVIYPLTGPAFMTTGVLSSEEIAISGLCVPGNSYCFYAIDTSARRLVIFDSNGSTGKSPVGNTRFFPPLSTVGALGYGLPAGLMVMGQDGLGTMIMVCGATYTAVNTTYGTTRREKLMWQKTIALPSLGGTATSICSAGSWFFVASTQGEVHQYLLATGAFVQTIASSETGSPIVKISNNSSVHVYWVTSGTNKQFNRLNVGSATIDATATFSTGVTAIDIAHDGNFGGGTRFAILTATGVYWLSNYTSGTPSHYIPAPDLTTVIGGIGTLSHIMYTTGETWWITDSGKDVVWEVHYDGSAPIGWPLGGMVDFI